MKRWTIISILTLCTVATATAAREGPAPTGPETPVHLRLSGRVFSDANGNGTFDPGEAPIPGAPVSDFWATVQTDQAGRYALDGTVKRGVIPVVYVTLPPGFMVFETGGYYRYIDWEGKREFTADFPLRPDKRSRDRDFCFVTSGDVVYSRMLQRLTGVGDRMDRRPRFVLTMGDLFVRIRGAESLAEQRAILREQHRKLGVPVFNCLGNHPRQWIELLGPPTYGFHYGGVFFFTFGFPRESGQSKQEQAAWLERELGFLPRGTPCVLFQHFPLWRPKGWPHWRLFSKRGLRMIGVFCSHTHRRKVQVWDIPGHGRVCGIDVGARISTNSDRGIVPLGFHVAGVRDGRIWASYELDGLSEFFASVSPAPNATFPREHGDVIVNAGGPLSTVRSMRARWKTEGPWVPLQPSGRWTWRAPAPPIPAGSRASVRVEATTLGGETWTNDVGFALARTVPVPRPDNAWTGPGGNEANTADVGATGRAPLALAWCRNVGAPVCHGGPILAGRKLHVPLSQYAMHERSGVVTLDAVSGEEILFDDHLALPIANRTAVLPLHYGNGLLCSGYAFGAPTARGDPFLVISEAATNKRLWQRTSRGRKAPFLPVKLAGNTLLLLETTDEQTRLAARDARAGTLQWRSELPASVSGRTNTDSPAVDRRAQRLFAETGCVSLADGKVLWARDQELLAKRASWWATTVATDGRSVFVHGSARRCAGGELRWTRARHKQDWKKEKLLVRPTLTALRGNTVVFAWLDGHIQAVHTDTGKPLWAIDTDLRLQGGLAVMGPAVYAVAREGVVLGFDLASGEEIWRREIGCPIYAYPAATGNTLYVADWGGNVYAFVGR